MQNANGIVDALGFLVAWMRSHYWDWSHGVRTCGEVPADEVKQRLPGVASAAHAIAYVPVHPKLLYRVFGTLPIGEGAYDLVDFGSGKGRVLLIAAEHPFRSILGVELNSRLHEIARKNIVNFRSSKQRCRDLHSICIDALEYEIPATPAVYFFFFPFREPVMRPVLDRIRRSLEAVPRDAFLVYVNPELAFLVEETGVFTPYYADEYCRIWRAAVSRLDSSH